MTPASLILARNGSGTASAAANELWARLVGSDPDADTTRSTSAALDAVAAHVGTATDVPDATLEEAVYRAASYLHSSAAVLGLHGKVGEDMEGDPRTGGYSALRRSGAMALLAPWRVRRAGAI